jgi:hypothetical protein
MVDETFKVWLIEANTNPCLEICCPLLSRLIPHLIENIYRFLQIYIIYILKDNTRPIISTPTFLQSQKINIRQLFGIKQIRTNF